MKTCIILAGLFTVALSAQTFAYIEKKELRLGTEGLESLVIQSGPGELRVLGAKTEGILVEAEIEVRGLSDEDAQDFIAEDIELRLRKEGNAARLKSDIREGFWKKLKAAVHLTVRVPDRLLLDIEDGSGSVGLEEIMGPIRLRDGSGSVRIRGATGGLSIVDGSGEIAVGNARGRLDINDGSGDIDIRSAAGPVVIEDGSGSITVTNVDGDLEIRDESGSITVQRVSGSVRVRDGSGSMDIRGVGKDVIVERDSSGSRRISDVGGSIREQE